MHNIIQYIENKSFLDVAKVAKGLVYTLSADKLNAFKKDLLAKTDYLQKVALFSESKAECEALAEKTNDLYNIIVIEQKNLFKKTPPPGKKISSDTELISSKNKLQGLKDRKERSAIKQAGIETTEDYKQKSDIIKTEKNTKIVTLGMLKDYEKEKQKEDRIQAVKQRKLTKSEREKVKDIKLYNLSIGDLHKKLEPYSVDLILTDPPYEKQAIPLFKDLSHFAGKVLKPGGSLLVMTGNIYIREWLNNLADCEGVNYHYMLHYIIDGPTPAVIKRKVFESVKPVWWFVKGSYTGEVVNNLIKCPLLQEKSNDYHKWGQSVDGVYAILEKVFAPAGDVVCDPFLGAGSTALASYMKGCRFIGSDIDPECVKITEGRLAKLVDNKIEAS